MSSCYAVAAGKLGSNMMALGLKQAQVRDVLAMFRFPLLRGPSLATSLQVLRAMNSFRMAKQVRNYVTALLGAPEHLVHQSVLRSPLANALKLCTAYVSKYRLA